MSGAVLQGADNLVLSECPSSYSDCWTEADCAFTLSSPGELALRTVQHCLLLKVGSSGTTLMFLVSPLTHPQTS